MKTMSTASMTTTVSARPDGLLLAVLCVIVVGGYIMMGSASMEYAGQQYNNPWFHIQRHGLYLLASIPAMIIGMLVPMQIWQRWSAVLLLIGFLALVAVLIPGIGSTVNGSTRWISLGFINIQCSEVAKLCMVFYMAGYLVRHEERVRRYWSGFYNPLLVVAVFVVLLLLEPDFGAVVVLMSAVLGMLFLAGVRIEQFLAVIVVALAAMVSMVLMSPYRFERLTTFVDPWPHQFDSGYQLVQSLIAFGRGEWFGLGLGKSVQKLFYLPEAHTDFVFAIIGEELGFIGAALVVLLFALLVWRILLIGSRCERSVLKFAAYCCYGIGIIFAAQAFINIGVNIGLLPTKGLTLPFFSYGGSSLIICFASIGLVLRAQYEQQLQSGEVR
jgi:cell division protein FtsW